jgi:hypothetical protein
MITFASQGFTPEQIAARRREQTRCAARVYYGKNKGSCILKHKKWKEANPKALQAAIDKRAGSRLIARQTAPWFISRPVKPLIWAAKRRAKRKGIPFDICAADLLPLPTHCPVLGTKLNYGPGRGRKLYENGAAASLDRIHNNNLGYVKGNVIIVSLRANLLKGQATIEELRKIADFYRSLP